MLTVKSQKGVGLIEVLVAGLILAIGVLGIAGLQSFGLKHNSSSYERTQATMLALDVFDRMRTNQTAADSGQYDYDGTTLELPAKTCETVAEQCSSAELATADLYEWSNQVADALPAGSALVTRDPVNTNIITATIRWVDERVEEPGIACGEDGIVCLAITTDL